MDSIIYVIQSIFHFIWTIIVGIFDILGWIIDRLVDAYHWCINTYQWFMELDTLYKIIAGAILLILIIIVSVYSYKQKERDRQRELEWEEWKYKKQHTCPQCNQEDTYHYKEKKIVDRYQGTKKVDEKTASGKYKTRHVKCMKVVKDKIWECSACGYTKVVDTVTEDLD